MVDTPVHKHTDLKLVDSWHMMPPWLCLLLGSLVYSAPVPENSTSFAQWADDPIIFSDRPLEELLSPQVTSTLYFPTSEPLSIRDVTPRLDSHFKGDEIFVPEDEKWWCGNNSFSRGMAHFIAKFDDNMKQINECCRIHDYEYDVARTFQEVILSDSRFDECLSMDGNFYRRYVVRPLFNTAINMNFAYEKLKSAFKSIFLGGDGFIDLR